MDYLYRSQNERLRLDFSNRMKGFISETKINIPSVLTEKFQVKLSGLITTSFN